MRYQITVKDKREFEEMEDIEDFECLTSIKTKEGYKHIFLFDAKPEVITKLRQMSKDKSSNIIHISASSLVSTI